MKTDLVLCSAVCFERIQDRCTRFMYLFQDCVFWHCNFKNILTLLQLLCQVINMQGTVFVDFLKYVSFAGANTYVFSKVFSNFFVVPEANITQARCFTVTQSKAHQRPHMVVKSRTTART